jgi:regulator of protease activity HflC (stomatin/prohibitin superfamily)
VGAPLLILAIALFIASILTLVGFVVLPPNQASVMLLFGKYIGSVKTSGFFWVNPFYSKKKISLRLRNFNTDKIKVNDKEGNPIEIAAVVVWQVNDTYDASFEVDDYVDYVEVQSEAAIRHLATRYPYDSWDEKEDVISLRGHIDEVSEALERELQERLGKAGVVVREARLSHLAYASEIAEAMLKRQQAGAIVAARAKIVEGAVGMVEMALAQLKRDQIVELDEERKATMVSNLLVVLCGDSNAQPVVNTGSLYS